VELKYEFSENEFIDLCAKNLDHKSTTIFEALYETLKFFLNTPSSVAITDIKHHYNTEFYDPHLSLQEYIDNGEIKLFYIQFDISSTKDTDLYISNVELPSFIKLDDFRYGGGVTTKWKIKNTEMKTKNKSSINLLTVIFKKDFLTKLYSKVSQLDDLLPSKLGVWEWRQTFYNRITGQVYFCTCFSKALQKDKVNISTSHPHLKKALKLKSFKRDICHICTNTNSDLNYCSNMYGSTFKNRYGAYITKLKIQDGIEEKDAENRIRELKGVAKIGERWINETLLFNYINLLFPEYTVQREATPSWLNRQRFDIYIPELNLAVEYQGQQHYKAIKLFGGEEGLKKTKERDKEKIRLSKENNVEIVFFTFKDNLSEKLVQNRLKSYLKQMD
jgi:hypothetical protein